MAIRQALFLLVLLPAITSAQQAATVFEKYRTAIATIHTISYDIHRADSFVTGDFRERNGSCMLQRIKEDSLFGYRFSGTVPGLQVTDWYNGQLYSFNHKEKHYSILRKPGWGIIGKPGGQMVVAEFMKADTGFTNMTLVVTPAHYELTLQFPDLTEYNVTNRIKILYLDKKNYLPLKVISSQQTLDKKQVLASSVSHVKINDKNFSSNFDHSTLLDTYTLPQPKSRQNELATLAGKPAPPFSLESFTGDSIHLDQYRGRLVLLDFWEVWCGPCVESLPKVQKLHEVYAGKGLTVLGVTLDKRNLSSNKLLAEKNKLGFINLVGNDTMGKNYNVNAIPDYILIDRNGTVILTQAGFDGNIEKMIKEKLGL